MSMYILKPWYKKDKRHTVSTTYKTIMYSGSGVITDTSTSSQITCMVTQCPGYTYRTSTDFWAKSKTYYSSSITLPEIDYSIIHTTGTLYGNYSTNQTIVVVSDTNSVSSLLSTSLTQRYSTSTYYSTFQVGLLNEFPAASNTDYIYFDYYSSTEAGHKSIPVYFESGLPYSFNMSSTNSNLSSYNLAYNSMRLLSYTTGANYYVRKQNVVYCEKSDPSKITVIFDNIGYFKSSKSYSSATVTAYRATLSEAEA